MSTRFLSLASALTLSTLVAAFASASANATAESRRSPSGESGAQQPRIINGRVAPHSAGSGLAATFRALAGAQSDVAWIGYSVPVSDRNRVMCCWSSAGGTMYMSGSFSGSNAPCCGSCRLEREASGPAGTGTQTGTGASGPVKLEGAERMVVLFRIAERQVDRIRTFSEDCELDAGGRQVHWIENVSPAESLALLESLVADGDRRNRVSNTALSAIGMHGDAGAAPMLIRIATDHASSRVRGEAIFWVAQMAGAKAAGTITEAIEKDPDTEVKRRAVFALSQLPKSEGVPLLIDVARKNRNPVVRKQAIFWLGQSKDPRALEFFTEILNR